MKKITLVDYLVELLKPYTHMPEFTTCVMKALKKLGHSVSERTVCVEENESLAKKCRLDPARFRACSIECDE
ncbi:MAG: hypothetical protein IMF11_18435 [Proteobacteria bacterium]|nr:hypothetical protein [Pseudomonadota bacterium]